MSYDVDVGPANFNMTSNLRAMFVDFGAYPKDFNGKTGQEVAQQIHDALKRIVDAPLATLEGYNAPNGWGKWEHGLKFLMEIRDAGDAYPEAIVEATA